MAEPLVQPDHLTDAWAFLTPEERLEGFLLLTPVIADRFFESLSNSDRADLILAMSSEERHRWMRVLPLDDATDLLQSVPIEERYALLSELDPATRSEVTGLLAYAEDDAGGLMNPRFPVVRERMVAEEALRYLRKQRALKESQVHDVFVLDDDRRLRGVLTLNALFTANAQDKVADLMGPPPPHVREETDQEQVAKVFADHGGLLALPVVDDAGRMVGVVTADDIVEVVEEEATEDIQKMGGVEALDVPYLATPFWELCLKRGKWLALLFVGELLTASAMGFFEREIERATVLSLFLPLIISSGGNSGSQGSTLIIRAMALREVQLKDWFRVFRRELACGLVLGLGLGLMGIVRIHLWQWLHFYDYNHVKQGADAIPGLVNQVGLTVGCALVGVVLWGSLMGAMLPFLLRRLRLDPATISAPLVATLVDVTGLIIYFGTAMLMMRTLLQS